MQPARNAHAIHAAHKTGQQIQCHKHRAQLRIIDIAAGCNHVRMHRQQQYASQSARAIEVLCANRIQHCNRGHIQQRSERARCARIQRQRIRNGVQVNRNRGMPQTHCHRRAHQHKRMLARHLQCADADERIVTVKITRPQIVQPQKRSQHQNQGNPKVALEKCAARAA